jgi:hypothetical protein
MEQQVMNEQPTCLSGAAPAVKVKRKWVRRSTLPPPPQIADAKGVLWQVRETRATEHGFDLLLGHPMPTPGVKRKRRLKGHIIPTRQLVDYWRRHSSDARACFNLPACYNALRRLYLRLRFKLVRYAPPATPNPMTDLKNMPVYEFAEHYKIPMTTAIRWRAILLERLRNPRKRSTRAIVLGVIQSSLTNREAAEAIALTADRVAQMRRNLQRRGTAYSEAAKGFPNKWNTPTALAVLRSGRPDSQIAHALGISTSHAHRLRKTLASL